jgi:hypothetical protein
VMKALRISKAKAMGLPTILLRTFHLGLVLLGIAAGCSGMDRHAASSNADDRYVKVEPHATAVDDSIGTHLAHPISLDETEWARILGDLSVRPRTRWLAFGEKEAKPIAAFSESDQRFLARHLADTISQIGPSKWMVFYLSHPQDSGVTEVTSGALFVQHGQLHLLLANYRYAVTVSSLNRQIREHPLWAKGESFFEFMIRPDQIVVTEPLWDLPKPFLAKFTELMVDIKKPVPLDNSRALQKSSELLSQEGIESVMSLEGRLRALDRLYRQGLITQEEYRLKRQQLLDRF